MVVMYICVGSDVCDSVKTRECDKDSDDDPTYAPSLNEIALQKGITIWCSSYMENIFVDDVRRI